MKRINAKTVKGEIISLLILAMALSFTRRSEIVKAIITAGAFVIVVPTAFFAAYGRKIIKSGKKLRELYFFF